MPEAIIGLEARIGTPCEDDPGPRDPVRFLSADQVPDDIERRERLRAFGASNPGLAHAVEQGVKRAGRAAEDIQAEVEVEVHATPTASRSPDRCAPRGAPESSTPGSRSPPSPPPRRSRWPDGGGRRRRAARA